ncbi:class I SAM-dependent RNA methyltransferase [Eggerthellaceae bacterium PR-HUZ602407-17]
MMSTTTKRRTSIKRHNNRSSKAYCEPVQKAPASDYERGVTSNANPNQQAANGRAHKRSAKPRSTSTRRNSELRSHNRITALRSSLTQQQANSSSYNRSAKLYCGCEWIDVPYDQQLERKQNALKQLLEPLNDTPFPAPTLHAIIPMDSDNPRAFRHKIVTPFAPLQAKTHRTQPRHNAAQTAAQRKPTHRECAHIACGFYMPGTHTIVPCFNCPSEPRVGRQLLNYLAKTASELGISAYDEDKHTGLLRHALLRISKHDGSILCVLVTNGAHIPQRKALISRLLKRFPAICSIVQNINTRRTNAVLSSTNRVLFGSGFVKDTLLGAQFSIGATTFFQTNPAQTERLYLCAIRALQKLDMQKPATSKLDAQEPTMPMLGVQKPATPQLNAPQSEMRTLDTPQAEMQTLDMQPSVTLNSETRPANSISVLDAYCGCGTISVCVAKHLPNAHVLGVDQVEQSIECARKNAQGNHVKKRCSFICADATQFMHELHADMLASTQEFVAPIEDVPVRDVVDGADVPVRDVVDGADVPVRDVVDGADVPVRDVVDGADVPVRDVVDGADVPVRDVVDGADVPVRDVVDGADVPVRDVVDGAEACPAGSTDDHTSSSTTRKHYALSQFTAKNDTNATRPFDCIIMDPPRSGSTPEFIEGAAHLQPRLIVYISCNPKTMVRDILQFQEFGYTATDITPVDMFPHTPHVETVVLMSKA